MIFCMKLGDYKGRNVTELDFWKKFLFQRYSQKRLQISPKSDGDIFLKNGSNDFFGFWPEVSTKYDLQFEWNLFFRKSCYLEIFDLEIVKIWLCSYNLLVQSMYCFLLTFEHNFCSKDYIALIRILDMTKHKQNNYTH